MSDQERVYGAEVQRAVSAERERCIALAEKAWMEHPLTRDRYHEPGCICYAIGRGACSECDRGEAILSALREPAPLPPPVCPAPTEGM